jgi:hypothetical protein
MFREPGGPLLPVEAAPVDGPLQFPVPTIPLGMQRTKSSHSSPGRPRFYPAPAELLTTDGDFYYDNP